MESKGIEAYGQQLEAWIHEGSEGGEVQKSRIMLAQFKMLNEIAFQLAVMNEQREKDFAGGYKKGERGRV
jgi:hypothetical protein